MYNYIIHTGENCMDIRDIRDQIGRDEMDYGMLMDCLKEYASPRAKITQMIKSGQLIRVKKGLYLVGKKYQQGITHPEAWANKIYGPSYVSLEHALSYYGMIPEYVATVTSVTTGRKKEFRTPIGPYTYEHLPEKLYAVGFNQVKLGEGQSAIIATREKALADLFYFRKYQIRSVQEIEELLFEDLRIEEEEILQLDVPLLEEIRKAGGSKLLKALIELIKLKRGK